MKQRYRIYRRAGGNFYVHDRLTHKQESLRTDEKSKASRLLHAKNEAAEQPLMNLQIARTYLAGKRSDHQQADLADGHGGNRETEKGETERRWLVAIKDKAFDPIRQNSLWETRSEHLLRVLEKGTVSTNVYLRRMHNFALDMCWLPAPILPRRCWPKVKFKEKRAVTLDEHQRIVDREKNPERRAFYELCWHLGGSQTDMACLTAEDINWKERLIS